LSLREKRRRLLIELKSIGPLKPFANISANGTAIKLMEIGFEYYAEIERNNLFRKKINIIDNTKS